MDKKEDITIENEVNNLLSNYDLFSKFNENKLNKTFRNLSNYDQVTLRLVPLLLHINQKRIPGYIESDNVPCGLMGFEVSPAQVTIFENTFKKNLTADTSKKNCIIESLALMGSVGSIAQTDSSDFDYWVCIKKDELKDGDYKNFCSKLAAIEAWAIRDRKLDVHFFPVDIKSAQANDFGETGGESCGSAQGQLLKDEFFRSSIVVEGKTPFWWVTPTETNDDKYNTLWKTVKGQEKGDDFLDLGNLFKISQDEFFGAGMWQLVKSLGNSFKSFMKMALLEEYLYNQSSSTLLSQRLKDLVINSKSDPDKIDSYILLFDRVASFYENSNNDVLLELLKKCFYIKIKPQITKYLNKTDSLSFNDESALPDKVKIMKEYVTRWGWDKGKVMEFDNYSNWPYIKLKEQNEELKNHLLNSFSKIHSYFKTSKIASRISERDMTVITRKLFSFYGKKKGKVVYFPISLQDKLYENLINLVHVKDGQGERWQIFRGKTTKIKGKISFSGLIKESKNLIDACIWLAFNRIYNPFFTRLNVYSSAVKVDFNNVKGLIDNFITHFHELYKDDHITFDFLKKPHITKCMLVPNFTNPALKEIVDLSFIYLNSWGEIFCEHYSQKDVMDLIKIIYENYMLVNIDFEEFLLVFVPQGSIAVGAELKNLTNAVYKHNYKKRWFFNDIRHLLLKYNGADYMCTSSSNEFSITQLEKYMGFFVLTQKYTKLYQYSSVFNNTGIYKILSVFFDNEKKDMFQVFYFKVENVNFVIFSDNYNKSIIKGVPEKDFRLYLKSLKIFTDFVEKNIVKLTDKELNLMAEKEIFLYEIKSYASGKYKAAKPERLTEVSKKITGAGYISLKIKLVIENNRFKALFINYMDASEYLTFQQFLKKEKNNITAKGIPFFIDCMEIEKDVTVDTSYQLSDILYFKIIFENRIKNSIAK